MSLSIALITLNEEANIERCLSSLKSFADEIILVDMGSTDQTLQKAKEFSAKIFTHPYTGFVEPARNYALDKTQGDWVFLIDADEELPKTLKLLLKELIREKSKSFYRVPRKNIIFGRWIKHAYWWPDYQIRFFKIARGNCPNITACVGMDRASVLTFYLFFPILDLGDFNF